MKELRPGSSGSSEVRMILAFDPKREAIFSSPGTSLASGKPGIGRLSRWLTTDLKST
jgi:hypothetical protein